MSDQQHYQHIVDAGLLIGDIRHGLRREGIIVLVVALISILLAVLGDIRFLQPAIRSSP